MTKGTQPQMGSTSIERTLKFKTLQLIFIFVTTTAFTLFLIVKYSRLSQTNWITQYFRESACCISDSDTLYSPRSFPYDYGLILKSTIRSSCATLLKIVLLDLVSMSILQIETTELQRDEVAILLVGNPSYESILLVFPIDYIFIKGSNCVSTFGSIVYSGALSPRRNQFGKYGCYK